MAQRFDPARGILDGEAWLVADSVFNPNGYVGYTVSASGLLAYQERPTFPGRS